MKLAIVDNSTGSVVREFEAPEGYTVPTHKFGPSKPERVVSVVELPAPEVQVGQQLVRVPDVITDTELRRGWSVGPAPVPEEVPMWAFRRALERVGMLNPVLAFIATLPHELRRDAETHLEYGNFIRRDHPLMAAAAQLGLDSDKVDDIFRVANELTDGVADFGAVAVNPGSEERKLWERVTGWVSNLFGGA